MNEPLDESIQSKGGKARVLALTKEERSAAASVAAEARWEKEKPLPKATHEGELEIGGKTIACAVLENQDGSRQRVITQSGFMVALGRARQAKGREYYDGDVASAVSWKERVFINLFRFAPHPFSGWLVCFSTITPAFGHRAFLRLHCRRLSIQVPSPNVGGHAVGRDWQKASRLACDTLCRFRNLQRVEVS